MAEGMVEVAIIKSITSYVSRLYKAYRRGAEPRVSKTIFPIPENIKELLKEIVLQCKDEDVFKELDLLVQREDRVKMLQESHKDTFQELEYDFTPLKFLKWAAVSVVIGAELETRGFKKALDVAEEDMYAFYSSYRNYEAFKALGFRVT